jgi:SAM-dependent methyltransferase
VAFQDHFSTRAPLYARARPSYPPALFTDLARLAPGRHLAWDCGTGNGQAAVRLAAEFEAVFATDPSSAQLAEAEPHPRVTYHLTAESGSGLAPGSVDLVTAAQAAHWFDLEPFYIEVTRVLREDGVCAIWCYGLCSIAPDLDSMVAEFYSGVLGGYWPADRRHVDDGYRSLPFPFRELALPEQPMRQEWTLDDFGAYLRSWSAVVRYQQARGTDPVARLLRQLADGWGDTARTVTFPLSGRVGRRA